MSELLDIINYERDLTKKIDDPSLTQCMKIRLSFKNGFVTEKWFREFDIKIDSTGKITSMEYVTALGSDRLLAIPVNEIVTVETIGVEFIPKELFEDV